MATINRERILNESPQKRLIISFDNLKNGTLTEDAALKHKAIYENMPLSFIIENSRYIFAEPIYGLSFYKEAVVDNEYGTFLMYESEGNKIHEFIEKYKNRMIDSQKKDYIAVEEALLDKCNDLASTILMAEYSVKSTADDRFEKDFSNALYEYAKNPTKENSENVYDIVSGVIDPTTFFTYAPYAAKIMNENGERGLISSNIGRFFNESTFESCTARDFKDPFWWNTFVETSVVVNKLNADKPYQEAIEKSFGGREKAVFEFLMTNPLEIINQVFTEESKPNAQRRINLSPEYTVNKLIQESILESSDLLDTSSRDLRIEMEQVYFDKVSDLLILESLNVDDPSNIMVEGYKIFDGEDITIEAAGAEIGRYLTDLDSLRLLTEAEDDEDDELDDLENDEDDDDNSDDENNVNKKSNAKDSTSNTSKRASSPKKVDAPNAGVLNKIQTKAQDIESKEINLISKAKHAGQALKQTGKAITAIPSNIKSEVEGLVNAWDKADDKRRKEFITKPGFRKKIFRNLKLAIMYGSVATFRLTFLPLTFMIRRMSKQKDRRIRNEVVRELQTEINICEAKIQDATDNNAKYNLMRIKSKLEAELLRVKTNSKYV